MWIWIIIGMGVVLLILVFFAVYFCIKNRKMNKAAALQYANGAGNDGELLEKDGENYGGKGAKRVNQFEDHQDLMESTHETIKDEPIPSPYALQ